MGHNPAITQRFAAELKALARGGTYRLDLMISGRRITLDIFPGVFPPASPHSISSSMVHKHFGRLDGMIVADIGCGSGYESIAAVIAGAQQVDAVDISEQACECTKHNAAQNGMDHLIQTHQGNLFTPLIGRRYNLVIANLPIVDCQPDEMDNIAAALYDPGWTLHRRLLKEAKEYLSPNGSIVFTHANLQSAQTSQPFSDFVRLEEMLFEFGYRIAARYARDELGYRWVSYRIQPDSHRWHRP